MVKTVRQFSVRQDINNSTTLNAEPKSSHDCECMEMKWTSATFTTTTGSLSAFFNLRLNPETGTEQKSIKIIVTLTNRNGEKFVREFKNESAKGSFACFQFDESKVGKGEELVVVSMSYDVEVEGLFQRVEKLKTKDFGVSDPVLTDVILVAGGQKFNVNKAILTNHSAYFRDLLASGNLEYELENIAPKVLQELLQVIYHVPEIYDDNVEELLEAARKFDVPLVTRNCAEYLGASYCRIVKEEKEELTLKYSLGNCSLMAPKSFRVQGVLDDVILKVEDQRFHVNRLILATHSSYFYTMFFGGFRESEQAEIELKHVDSATFQDLLDVIYHFPYIHECNVEQLLEAARMYTVQPATSQCEKFLMGDKKMENEEKGRLVEEYELEKLYGFF